MKKLIQISITAGFAVSIAACSSSHKAQNGVDPTLDANGNSSGAAASSGADPVADTDPAPAEPTSGDLQATNDVPPPPSDADQQVAQNDVPPAPADGGNLDQPPVPADQAQTDQQALAQAETPPPPPADEAPAAPVAQAESPASKKHKHTHTPAAMASAPSAAGSGNMSDYTVQASDTLMKIAFETYGDLYQWKKIYDDNRDRIQDPNHVPAGTVLKIDQPANPPHISKNGEKYEIRPGDTLGTISQSVYGTKSKWKKIWHNNEELIKDPNKIYAGFYLYYTMSPEDQQQMPQLTMPAPLAKKAPVVEGDVARAPAANQPGGAQPTMPAQPGADNPAPPPVTQ